MSARRSGDAGAGPPTGFEDGRTVLFWIHQLVEYVLAIGLGWAGARSSGTAQVVLLAAAVAIGLVAALTDGPLGAGRLLSRRTHRVLDVVLLVVAAVGGVALIVTGETAAGAVLVAVAALLTFLWRRTRYERRPSARRDAARAAVDAALTTAVQRRSRPPGPSTARALGRLAGRARDTSRPRDE
jgi:hypothetical protein